MGTVTGHDHIGGVAGMNIDNSEISNCYNKGNVSVMHTAGGVVGTNFDNAKITNCYNTGTVTGDSYIGGVAGLNESDSEISNCYNMGGVTGNDRIGGVVGYNIDSTVRNCYYLNDCGADGEGTSLTEDDFNNQDSFRGWDFNTVWQMDNILRRPTLISCNNA